ncbi:MAG TPA: hypothetical protein VJM11_02245 [Nevskiaceae bacterium]|nr:hypothetical protein [Nevskiaceae bacterium]
MITVEQITLRGRTVMTQHASYAAFVERCVNIMIQAHDLGWKTAVLLNGERAVRVAESLLGIHVRSDFEPQTELSRLIYGG